MLKYIVYPLIGGFLGALINVLVLTCLLYRKKNRELPNKKHELFARDLSSALCGYFFDARSLSELITEKKVHGVLKDILFNSGKRVPMFATSILSGIAEYAVSNTFFEGGIIKQELLRKLVTADEAEDFIYRKIMAFDKNELKRVIFKVMGKEMLLFVLLGGITGIVIGFVQAFLPL
ncbi:MAG: hypothetical protein J1G30_06405 [Spirochaetales bacterium]|nr:hypothetical protein [Spirochaetales bacterium]